MTLRVGETGAHLERVGASGRSDGCAADVLEADLDQGARGIAVGHVATLCRTGRIRSCRPDPTPGEPVSVLVFYKPTPEGAEAIRAGAVQAASPP